MLREAQSEQQRETEVRLPYRFGGKGTVLSYTVVSDAPEGFEDQAPYTLALIRLEEGATVLAQLTDLDKPAEIGMPVEMVTRRLRTDGRRGMIVYGYKFRPLLPRA